MTGGWGATWEWVPLSVCSPGGRGVQVVSGGGARAGAEGCHVVLGGVGGWRSGEARGIANARCDRDALAAFREVQLHLVLG